MTKPTKILIAVLVVFVAVMGGWFALYPSARDSKSMQYRLWKAGLFNLSVSEASDAMVGDPNRDALIVGKTKSQLETKFGHLLGLNEVSPYFKEFYMSNPAWRHETPSFIKDSAWMILFEHDKGRELVLVKG